MQKQIYNLLFWTGASILTSKTSLYFIKNDIGDVNQNTTFFCKQKCPGLEKVRAFFEEVN